MKDLRFKTERILYVYMIGLLILRCYIMEDKPVHISKQDEQTAQGGTVWHSRPRGPVKT